MPEVTIYGASDDLIEVEGAGLDEEYNLPGGDGWEGSLLSPEGENLIIRVEFGHGGDLDWTIGVHAENGYPSWPIHFTERPGYEGDPAVVIDVPEGTTLTTNADEE